MIIPANIAVEDALSEAVLRRITAINGSYYIGTCYRKGGYGYLKNTANGFNNASKGTPFILLCDLEDACAPSLIKNWLTYVKHPNFIFRVAIKEVEAWLLADSNGIALYFGISHTLVPQKVDEIPDPKKCLIELARRSRKRIIRTDIVPKPGTTAQIGPNYNDQLSNFVNSIWDIPRACVNSDSLRRAVKEITNFKPI